MILTVEMLDEGERLLAESERPGEYEAQVKALIAWRTWLNEHARGLLFASRMGLQK